MRFKPPFAPPQHPPGLAEQPQAHPSPTLPQTQRLLPHAVLLTAALLTLPGGAAALDVGGVKVPDTLTIYNNALVLNGAGLYAGAKNQRYVMQVYAKQKFTSLDGFIAAPGPKRLVLHALRDVDTLRIMTALNRSVEDTADKNNMSQLFPGLSSIGNTFKATPVLRPGSVMSMDWVPVFGMTIYIDGRLQGEPMRQADLFRGAAGVWLGETPVDAKLKDALLGRP